MVEAEHVGSRDQRTQERAHQVREQEGCPEAREREHWDRAAREIEEQEADRDSSDRGAPEGTTSRSRQRVSDQDWYCSRAAPHLEAAPTPEWEALVQAEPAPEPPGPGAVRKRRR